MKGSKCWVGNELTLGMWRHGQEHFYASAYRNEVWHQPGIESGNMSSEISGCKLRYILQISRYQRVPQESELHEHTPE